MKAYALIILTLFATTVKAQNSLNNYKYVLVPEKWDFFKAENQYGLNTLTKVLLEQFGFTAVMTNENMPAPVAANKCNALKAELIEKKSLFVTNLTVQLKDCQGNVVFKSKEGKSREKEWQAAYTEALTLAFNSFNDAHYKYDSVALAQAQPATTAPAPATVTPTTAAAPATTSAAPAAVTDATGVLYAQPTANGFQLIDTTPKKVLTLFKTSLPDHYIAQDGSTSGLVFKKNDEWHYEYYRNEQLVSQKLQIKF